jgi:glycosyltransferase involved in cell wall biosynthesis
VKVVHVTTVHRVDDTRIYERYARSLKAAKIDVVVVGANATKSNQIDLSAIDLRIPSNRLVRLILASFIARRSIPSDADVIHFHDPELLPLLFKKQKNARYVYDVHESYTEQISVKSWIPPQLRPTVKALVRPVEQFFARRADLIVCATERIGMQFDDNTLVIQNFPTNLFYENIGCAPTESQDGPIRILHLGHLNDERGLQTLRSVLHHPHDLNIELHQFGPIFGDDSLICKHQLVPYNELPKIISQYDIGVILYSQFGNHLGSQPNKLFEYLTSGIPIIASDIAIWRKIAQQTGGKVEFVNPKMPHEVRKAVGRIFQTDTQAQRRTRSKTAYQIFNWDQEFEKYLVWIQNSA